MPDAAPAQRAQPEGKPPLSKPGPPTTPGKTVECRHCHQWETAADDGYCSFCGHLLLSLEVQPESLILISTLAPQKDLIFRNAGAQALQGVIVPRTGPKFPALVFEPPSTFDIPANGEVRIRVGLDAEKLPADLQEKELDYICLVNNDPRKQFPLKITVRSGPRPKLLTPVLQFGEIQEGKSVERNLEISNSGGIPLNVREVRPEGSSHLRLKEAFTSSLIQPGKKLSIPVRWDSRGDEKEADPGAAGIRITFGNHPASLLVPARAKTFRYFLDIKPASIQLPQVLVKQDYPVKVEIENRGTTDLEISAIESDRPWLEVISRASTFTLLCAESSTKRLGELAPTTFAKSYSFTVACHPQELPAGKHQGRITVRPLGQDPKSLGVEINVLHPRPYPDYIGIDFGTTNSVVAVFNPETYDIELVEDGVPASPLIPSVLVFEDAETYVIGQAARNAVNAAPDRSVRSIKRIMGYDHEREFCGRKFSPEALASRIIRKLVQLAEWKLQNDSDSYFDIRKAIITVPANFYDLQIRGVLEACKAAGLDTEEEQVKLAAQAMRDALSEAVNAGVILDEPSAAVLYYIHFLSQARNSSEVMQAIDRKEGLRLLVFDYGGGTLDVSVANVIRLDNREGGLRILANMGDNAIGGDSIDLILMRDILKRCKAQAPNFDFDITLITVNYKDVEARRERESWSAGVWREVLRVRLEWKDLSEAVKIQFSEREQAETEIRPDLIIRVVDGKVQIAPRSIKITIPRSVLEDLLQGIIDKCKRLVDSALNLAKLDHEEIDYILHTGRQSLLPLIPQRVREIFPSLPAGRDILDPEHIKLCVAKGAALYGWMRDKLGNPEARVHFLSEGRRLPHSYGVEKFANFLQPEFDEVIPRGSTYPSATEKVYGPEMIPSSGYLNLKFYQNTGANKRIVRNPEVRQIGQISINTLADGDPGCVVRFVIDANRKLEVFADGHEVTIQPARLQGEESWMG